MAKQMIPAIKKTLLFVAAKAISKAEARK